MTLDKPLLGELVRLDSCDIEDAEYTLKLRKNPEIGKYMPVLNISVDEQREWIAKQREQIGDYFLVVREVVGGERIGTISLYDIYEEESEFGRLICEGPKGCAAEATSLILDFGFYDLGLKTIRCYAYADNERAIGLYKKVGFEYVGDGVDANGTEIKKFVISRDRYEGLRKY